MKAAIYCRVSTEGQEQEGTSLQTQLEACQKYCQLKGYQVAYQFIEAWSGSKDNYYPGALRWLCVTPSSDKYCFFGRVVQQTKEVA